MSKASDSAQGLGFDPAEAIPRSHALTPQVIRVNEARVRRGFWPKLRKAAAHIPFAAEVLQLYYCATDLETPASAKALAMAALAYFVVPWDAVPDVLAVVGYTDDAAVVAAVLAMVARHLKPRHKQAARAFLDRLARDA